MELRFLGRTYSASPKQIATVPSIHIGCFRGQRYSIQLPVQTSNIQQNKSLLAASIRKYRGVAYIVPFQEFPPTSDKREICYR